MKSGLVMEGGAMRGLFTAGVTDVMLENDITFDGAIGVSAGACFGCNFKSKQAGRAYRYNIKYVNDPRYFGVRSLLKTGNIFGAEFCYHELPEKLDVFDDMTFEDNPMEFYVVSTDAMTGKAVYHKCDKAGYGFFEWVRASSSMPLVSKIVEIDGLKMMDGGISDSVPIRFFESIGYDRNVIILTQPSDYVKNKNSLMPIIRMTMKKYPKLIDALAKRHEIYNETVEYVKKLEQDGRVFVIRPEAPLGISRLERNPEELTRVYEAGRKAAEENLSSMRAFLGA